MTILDRFLKYAKIPTFSDSNSNKFPSTDAQFSLADVLYEELKELGVEVYYDQEHCYLYGLLKGNIDAPKIGFISHMDTSEAAKGDKVNPRVINNYDGQDIQLSNDIISRIEKYKDLKNHVGKTLITSDGKTLIGADDKSGIAEIMSMLEYFKSNNEEHGDIYVCFTPDEEIGDGTLYFNIDKFPVDFAYTVDGEDLGEISYENFNAASASIVINGVASHAGHAKGTMINSLMVANRIVSELPKEYPENTEGMEGFYHLEKLNGTVDRTTLEFLIRDFSKDGFENRKQVFWDIVARINAEYGNIVHLDITDTYYNMQSIMQDYMHVINIAKKATESCGIIPIVKPIRGGTDGARITFMGIPCPNLGAGGHNFHSIYEYVALEDMERICQILIAIVKEYTKSENNNLRRIK